MEEVERLSLGRLHHEVITCYVLECEEVQRTSSVRGKHLPTDVPWLIDACLYVARAFIVNIKPYRNPVMKSAAR